MYLKRLEIQGFKSFARKTTLEFERGITAIVGPNGSGKSNVADCLRWVLGEQSAKLMRGKKSDDVIFAGSDKKVRAGFAEVFATFDNRDHKIPVDAAEVSIGRRIDRSGDSEYLLNGQRVRLLDIVDLVLKSNIGTSRYTVIGQGTIDQMILSGPSEIKNLLDEASGVKTYYIRRDKTLRRLEQTAQNLMRAEDLIAEIEPRLKSLRRQAKRMEARAEYEITLRAYLKEWLGGQYWLLLGNLSGVQNQLSTIVENKTRLTAEIDAQRALVEKSESLSTQDIVRYKAIQQELAELQDRKNKLLENLSLVRGKMESQKTSATGNPASLEATLHGINRKLTEVETELSGHRDSTEQAKQNSTQIAEVLREVNAKLDHIYSNLSNPVSVDLEAVNLELDELESALNGFYQTMDQVESISEIKTHAESFRTRFQSFKSSARELLRNPAASHAKLQQDMQGLVKHKEQLTKQLSDLEVRLSKASMAREFLERQLEDLKQQELNTRLELQKATSGNQDEFWKQLVSEEEKIQKSIEELGKNVHGLQASLQEFYQAETKTKQTIADADRMLRVKQDELNLVRDRETQVQVEKAKIDTQLEALIADIHQQLGAEFGGQIMQERVTLVTSGLEEKIQKLKSQLEGIGGVDDLTLQEYQETEGRYTHLTSQVADLKKGMQDLRQIIDELDEHIKVKFNEAFHLVNAQFEQYFRMLFNGGRAYLSVIKNSEIGTEEINAGEDGEDKENIGTLRPEEKIVQKYEKGASNVSGVDIKATPPGKKLASIQALSGGERALTSIALLCSLLTCFPSPFVVLDEVDAALDEANTIRFGQILGTLAHQTQFITITHNRETMAQSNTLYGVTMGDDGISKLLSIKLEQAKIFAKQ
jgi:chromosome segregation protein